MAKTVNKSNKSKSFTLGMKRFAKISAVEGITMSREIKRDFNSFDREGLSDEDRRRKLHAKYGKKSA